MFFFFFQYEWWLWFRGWPRKGSRYSAKAVVRSDITNHFLRLRLHTRTFRTSNEISVFCSMISWGKTWTAGWSLCVSNPNWGLVHTNIDMFLSTYFPLCCKEIIIILSTRVNISVSLICKMPEKNILACAANSFLFSSSCKCKCISLPLI